jgi:hypothetical protein
LADSFELDCKFLGREVADDLQVGKFGGKLCRTPGQNKLDKNCQSKNLNMSNYPKEMEKLKPSSKLNCFHLLVKNCP